MPRPMTASQHDRLLHLAEKPSSAARLLQRLDAVPRQASALWDIYCIALLTVCDQQRSQHKPSQYLPAGQTAIS